MNDIKLVFRQLLKNPGFTALAVLAAALNMRTSHGAEPRALTVSMEDCIQWALERNLDLRIARYYPEVARRNLALAHSRYEPVFSSSGTRSFSSSPGGIDEERRPFPGTETEQDALRAGISGVLPGGLAYDLGTQTSSIEGIGPGGPFENTSGTVSIQLRQPLLRNFWIDGTRLAVQLSKRQLLMSELALQQQIMNVVTTTELAYYDLILARENVQVQEQALALAERLLAATQRRVELELLPALDEKQSESQVAARQAALQSAQRALITQEYSLKSILNDDLAAWHDVALLPEDTLLAVPVDLDLHASWGRGLAQRPDLRQMRTGLERQGIVLKFLRNQMFPQLDLVGSYGLRGSDRGYSGAFGHIAERSSPFYSAGVVLSVPLGNRSARQNLRIGQAEQEQMLLQFKRLEQDIMVQIGVAVEQARSALRQVDSTREARRFAEMALAAEERKLENGKSTSFIVLQLQRDLTAARTAELQALAEYNKALAQLALREGATLERHGIRLEYNQMKKE